MSALEDAVQAAVDEELGEHWPVVAWVVYAVAGDPETMTNPEKIMFTPDGQWAHSTKGLLGEAAEILAAENAPLTSYAIWDESEDDED